MSKLVSGIVLKNQQLGNAYYNLTVAAREIAKDALPGQFVHIRCSNHLDPLLRRPLSIHRIHRQEGAIELLLRVKGRGTEVLAGKTAGERLDLVGPLGNGFSLDIPGPVILVGGGIGVAPLLGLADYFSQQGKNITVFIGANSAGDLLKTQQFDENSSKLEIATIDGSSGYQGLVTKLLEKYLKSAPTGYLYTCGPEPMLKAVAGLAARCGMNGEASLETGMACGTGACLGCICEVKEQSRVNYARVCTEGPVFPLEAVVWRD